MLSKTGFVVALSVAKVNYLCENRAFSASRSTWIISVTFACMSEVITYYPFCL